MDMEKAAYRTYVGPGSLYDIIGASQFALSVSCGLREQHLLLDFGCGSLRGGRFFIPYLRAGHYYGVEPNQWLVDQAVQQELGADMITLKAPHFAAVNDFSVPFDVPFHMIVAQSIFTHTGKDLMRRLFASLAGAISPEGLILATFFLDNSDEERSGWFYFDSLPNGQKVLAAYRQETVCAFAAEVGLHARHIHFWHPAGQQWFLFSKTAERLPTAEQASHFYGLNVLPPLP
ncbi:MAG: class I SAM-dependent methyltransferase [Desulfovibrio sp.]|nr:class I SAM-dependent methyltransferase [Desulfovibrio sp.]